MATQESDGQLPKGTSKLDFIPIQWKKDLMRLKMQGTSNNDISRYLKKQYNYKAAPQTIATWFKTSTDLGPTRIFARKAYVNELETQYVETLHEFKKMVSFTNDVIKAMWRDAKNGTVDDKAKVLVGIRELRAQIELANSLHGALPKDKDQLEDVAKSVNMALQSLDKQGLLKKYKDETDNKEKKEIEGSQELNIEVPGVKGGVMVKKRVGLNFE